MPIPILDEREDENGEHIYALKSDWLKQFRETMPAWPPKGWPSVPIGTMMTGPSFGLNPNSYQWSPGFVADVPEGTQSNTRIWVEWYSPGEDPADRIEQLRVKLQDEGWLNDRTSVTYHVNKSVCQIIARVTEYFA